MTEQGSPLRQQLQEILEKEAFDALDLFQSPSNWNTLKEEEKSLLARLFIKKGEMELKRDHVFKRVFQ